MVSQGYRAKLWYVCYLRAQISAPRQREYGDVPHTSSFKQPHILFCQTDMKYCQLWWYFSAFFSFQIHFFIGFCAAASRISLVLMSGSPFSLFSLHSSFDPLTDLSLWGVLTSRSESFKGLAQIQEGSPSILAEPPSSSPCALRNSNEDLLSVLLFINDEEFLLSLSCFLWNYSFQTFPDV